MKHVTVLKQELIEQLNLTPGGCVVDATLGSGGHASAALVAMGGEGTLIGFDADPAAIARNQDLRARFPRATVHLINRNFSELPEVLATLGFDAVDAVMADLGWRSEQFSSAEGQPRGFSFNADEPLLMTFGNPAAYAFTVADIVNDWDEVDIANVIFGYGEERAARRIAAAIVRARSKNPIRTANELASIIEATLPRGARKVHPATKTFQALRIAVNDEFAVLESLLAGAINSLRLRGRLGVITFHSLEDRIVKHTFRDWVHDQRAVLVHKKPIVPTQLELRQNPRSRSAKLRCIEKTI